MLHILGPWANAIAVAKTVGSPWRLPNIKELASITDAYCTAADAVFPSSVVGHYWSSTLLRSATTQAYAVDTTATGYGSVISLAQTNALPLRLVKDAQ